MNLVALIGNVASAPECRYTDSGKAVCTFRLAISRPNGTDADFVTVVAWERQAEVCERYAYVGRRLGVEGRLHHATWETDEGNRRSAVEVIAHRVQLLGAPRTGSRDADDGNGADRSSPDTPQHDAGAGDSESGDDSSAQRPIIDGSRSPDAAGDLVTT